MKLAAIISLAAILPMSIFAKDTKEQAFGKWFEKNQDDLYHFEKDREAFFDGVSRWGQSSHGNMCSILRRYIS